MISGKKQIWRASASLLILGIAATDACAQAGEATTTQSSEVSRDASLNAADIVVTAQKRQQRLMDAPLAVSAFTGTEIEDKGYSNISGLLQRSPGVTVTGGNVQIRGISSIFGAATVGYYLDEIPFSFAISATLPDVNAWDLDRLEVLRGPQGTLYGANSIGGTIRILTKNPDLGRVEGKAEGEVGFIQGGAPVWELRGAVNLPIVEDRVAVRLAATHSENGGYIDSPLGKNINDTNRTTLRAKLALKPTETTRVTFSAWSNDTKNDNPVSTNRDQFASLAVPTTSSLKYQTYGGIVEQEGPGFNITSATSYLHLKSASRTSIALAPGVNAPVISDTDAKTFAQEIRLVSSGTGPLRWTAGGYYQNGKEGSSTDIPGLYTDVALTKSKAWAVFGEVSYRLGSLEATAGLRYFHDKRTDTDAVAGYPTLPAAQADFHAFNPKFNLSWHASDNSLFYGTVAKGFRSGQNQPLISSFLAAAFGVAVPQRIDPETLWSYEIGNKTKLLDGKMTIETALYYNDWKDLQVTIQATSVVGALVNAGKARAYGADLAITYRPVKGLSLSVSGNINDSKYESTVPTAIRKGDRITYVPKYTFNASGTYTTPLTSRLNFYAFAELQQGGRRYLTAQSLVGRSDTQSIVNARVGVEGKGWGAYITAKNLLNENGFQSVPLVSTNFEGSVPQPRTIGLLLRTNY